MQTGRQVDPPRGPHIRTGLLAHHRSLDLIRQFPNFYIGPSGGGFNRPPYKISFVCHNKYFSFTLVNLHLSYLNDFGIGVLTLQIYFCFITSDACTTEPKDLCVYMSPIFYSSPKYYSTKCLSKWYSTYYILHLVRIVWMRIWQFILAIYALQSNVVCSASCLIDSKSGEDK